MNNDNDTFTNNTMKHSFTDNKNISMNINDKYSSPIINSDKNNEGFETTEENSFNSDYNENWNHPHNESKKRTDYYNDNNTITTTNISNENIHNNNNNYNVSNNNNLTLENNNMEKNPHEINSNISINEKPINEGHDKSLHKHSNSITKAINFFHKSKGGESPIRKLNRNIKKTIRSLSPIRKDIYGTGKKDKNKHTKNVKRESSTYSNTKLSNDITNDLTGPTYSKCSSIGNNSNSNCRLSNDKMNEIVHYTNTEIDYSKTNNNTNKEFIDSYSNTNSGTTLNNINNQNNNYRNKLNRTSQQQPEFKIVDVISVHSNCSNENEVDNNFDYSYSQKDSQSNRNSNKAESDIHYNYYNHQNKEYSVSAHSTSSVDKLHSYSLVHDQSPRHYKKNSYNSYKDKRKYHNSYNSCHSNNSSLRYENWNYNKSQEFDDYGNIPDSVRNGDDYNYESLQEINRSNFNQDVIPETAEEYTTSDNNDYNTIITEKNSYIKNQNELPINNEPTKSINYYIIQI